MRWLIDRLKRWWVEMEEAEKKRLEFLREYPDIALCDFINEEMSTV